ncbi:MAG: mechanosensitive ion channel domain-containing protein [Acidobacteriota bacterium]|nr:mechanosensitive ion channel domain-containing protein [Acidobacteriota bacterium]
MWQGVRDWIETLGLEEGSADLLTISGAMLVVAVAATVAYYVTRFFVTRVLRAAVMRTDTRWDNELVEAGVFTRLSHLVPALVLQRGAGSMLSAEALRAVDSVISAYLVLIAILTVDALLNAIQKIWDGNRVSRRFQIRTVVQVAKLAAYFLGGIAVLALLMRRSPLVFFSGLGAFTAVLMLVFRDAILGFVAGIQLSVNNMVRRGDWIEMPAHGADGDVIDVSLTTVKVQNWDKTVSTIPTYALVSESFKNWRGMSESGGRRIKRSISIDMTSVRFCDAEMLDRFQKIQYISDYVKAKLDEVMKHNEEHGFDTSILVNGRHLTNLGTFRAYIEAYLHNHPKIHPDMTFLVRQLPPSELGLPIEIYVFSNDQDWIRYEAIQGDIFDHIIAVLPLFDLTVFQAPTGADLRALDRLATD